MKTLLRLVLLLVMGCVLTLPLLAADDDDEEDGGGAAGVANADVQWRWGDAAWNNRLYDDAYVYLVSYATKNPDHDNALEAWWRAYLVYQAYRQNSKLAAERRKDAYGKGIAACKRWQGKYATSNKKRAAQGLWYEALISERELGRPQAISLLTDLVKKYPEQAWSQVYWHLAEWQNNEGRNLEAAENYLKCRDLEGMSDLAGHCTGRAGNCYLSVKRNEDAVNAYRWFLDNEKKINWWWWGSYSNATDAAERLKGIGEDELARRLALKMVSTLPQDWNDWQARWRAVLNEKAGKRIYVYPHFYYYYSANTMNVAPGANVDLDNQYNLLVRLSYVNKENPFKGTLTVAPKTGMDSVPKNMAVEEKDGGKKVYTAQITAPDDKGNVQGDWWFNFSHKEKAPMPSNLVITRKWEKAGATWGQCVIRIQTTDRWNVYIYMPNDKTNVNNLSQQPNEVRDNGRTFVWYGYYDMSKGWEIKFPIEVGGNIAEYYPKIFLDRGIGIPYQSRGGTSNEIVYSDIKEFDFKLNSEQAFPYSVSFPGYIGVTVNEVVK